MYTFCPSWLNFLDRLTKSVDELFRLYFCQQTYLLKKRKERKSTMFVISIPFVARTIVRPTRKEPCVSSSGAGRPPFVNKCKKYNDTVASCASATFPCLSSSLVNLITFNRVNRVLAKQENRFKVLTYYWLHRRQTDRIPRDTHKTR